MEELNSEAELISISILNKLIAFNPTFNKEQISDLLGMLQNSAELDDTASEEVLEAYKLCADKLSKLSDDDIISIRRAIME